MNPSLITLLAGPVISFLVSAGKRWNVVADHPKTVALIASAGVAALQTGLNYHGIDVGSLATQVLVPFAGAVATHEAVTKQVEKLSE